MMAQASEAPTVHPDRVRGVRCSLVVGDILTKLMQEVMGKSQVTAKILYGMIQNDRHFRSKITPDEMSLIQTLHADSYSKLDDINLMYKLMRYFKGIVPEPTRGWKNIPQPYDLAIGDDICRIKEVRNIYAHNICPPLSETEMDDFFFKYSELGKRVDLYLKKSENDSYEKLILSYKECSIDQKQGDRNLQGCEEKGE